MTTATVHRFLLPITTEQNLKDFLRHAFNVTIPDTQVCPNHSTPWRAFADAYFARSSTSVWEASRGFGGKTFLLGLLALTEALTLKANANVLGGSGEQSDRVLDHMTNFWKAPNAPRHLLVGDVAREMRFAWGNKIEALMASTKSARGAHPHRLRLDEVDEMDLKILDAATGQPMQGGSEIPTQTVMSSTHQYADGTMTEILRRAAEKGWTVHTWCYRENLTPHGWLTQAQVERKRADVTRGMWENEYELQEPAPESRAIDTASVKAMFKAELGTFAGEARQYIEIEPPNPEYSYVTGADWAKTTDWTIIITFRLGQELYDAEGNPLLKSDGSAQKTPARLVAFERLGREPYPAMVARFNYQVMRYSSTATHDGTGGGTVVEDLLGVAAESFKMVGQQRADLLSNYIGAIEKGEIEAPFIRYMESEHRLASRADVFMSGEGHLPDTISAGALAWRGRGTWLLA